ncbi:MAG TPA: hypothetical protein PLZ57_10450 [Pseudobdellovibrionaceae bacterium]|nr:hypothetical protein [Pseudobdellovibrionaceae bacterium]
MQNRKVSQHIIKQAFSFLIFGMMLSTNAVASVKAIYEIPTLDPQLQSAAFFEIKSDADAYNSNGRAANELRLELPAALTGRPHSFTLIRQAQLGHFAGSATQTSISSSGSSSGSTTSLATSPATATAICSPEAHDVDRGDWVVCDMQFFNLEFDSDLRDQILIRDFKPSEFFQRQSIARQFEGQPIGRLHYRVR